VSTKTATNILKCCAWTLLVVQHFRGREDLKHFHDRLSLKKGNVWQRFLPKLSVPFVLVVLLLCAVLLVGTFAIRIGQVQQKVDSLVSADRDQALWTSTQIQVELLEFKNLVRQAKVSPLVTEQQVRAEFNVLYARLSQVMEPNVAYIFREDGRFSIPLEIVNLRDRMAATVDLNDALGLTELDRLVSLATKANRLWTQSIGLVLQETREYKISVRQEAVDILRSVQSALWLGVVVAVLMPFLLGLLVFARARYKEARQSTLRDPLTGCASRAGLKEALATSFSKAKDGFSLAVVDIDGLKMINDRFGHKTGDMLIKNVGTALARVTRGIDCIARIGGDEFVLLLDARVEQAELILKRAQEHLAEMHDTGDFGANSATMSYGVAHCANAAAFEESLEIADQRMYSRKQMASAARSSDSLTATEVLS
jgi:diguanylate cyclase (GGDEF)-like protein